MYPAKMSLKTRIKLNGQQYNRNQLSLPTPTGKRSANNTNQKIKNIKLNYSK